MDDGKRIKEKKKLPPTRRFIATRMAESLRDYPQMSGSIYIETDKVFALKDELKAQNSNVSMTAMFTKIIAQTLQAYPIFNSALIDGELEIYESVNIGVGVGLDQGIMTVVIKEAQDKSIFEISDELQEKMGLLRQNKLPIADMKGSTFTVSNVGMMGFEAMTPVLNPPETGLLGIGHTKKTLVVNDDDSTSIKQMTCFSITSNHAVVDGYHGGMFCQELKKILLDPKPHMGL